MQNIALDLTLHDKTAEQVNTRQMAAITWDPHRSVPFPCLVRALLRRCQLPSEGVAAQIDDGHSSVLWPLCAGTHDIDSIVASTVNW